MIKIAFCDDDFAEAEKLSILTEKYLTENNIEHSISLFGNPIDLSRNSDIFDIFFLDIEMPDLSGVDLAKKIYAVNPDAIIFFITNYDYYLDDAFDLKAFRYLTKPVDPARLLKGIKTAADRILKKENSIYVHIKNEIVRIEINSIVYAEIVKRNVRIATLNGEKLVDDKLKDILDMLPSSIFVSPRRSYIVNMCYIEKFDTEKIYLYYSGKRAAVYISKRMYTQFKKQFALYARGAL